MTAAIRGPSTSAHADRILAELVEQFLGRLQAGEPIDPSGFAAEHPEYAEALRQLLPALELMADLSRSLQGRPGLDVSPMTGTLGDFRIIREVGRGGMGVVFEAEQISLGRRVALKVLPFAAAMDPQQLARFKLEAQAAAQLHHTHIVPVYSVGSERGVHYYAMQFIEGRSLAALIRELRDSSAPGSGAASAVDHDPTAGPSPPATTDRGTPTPSRTREFLRNAARLGIEAAEALEHAHQFGILHRDIKPANLLIDDRGHLWVADFGLARFGDAADLTLSGDLLGTLRYMSPERATGSRVGYDQRTDVYSLGVTLYELLTLRPAFDGPDRAAILRQVTTAEPREPRSLNPAIPADLETIVLKALAREPGDRYTTSQELADDLRRFLEHKPIRARRPAWPERAIKWARRHMMLVGSTAMLLVLAVVGLSISLILIARERARTEVRYRTARRAVDQMYTRVAERWLSQQPRLEPLQREFLNEARQFYEEFAREPGTDPGIRYEAARASDRVGNIERRLGHPREAEAGFRRAIAILDRLVAEDPRRKLPRSELANVYSHIGMLFEATGRHGEAESALRRSADLHEALAREFPDDPGILAGLVANLVNRSQRQNLSGRVREAEDALRKAADIQRRQAALRPDEAYAQSALGATLNNLAQTVLNRGDPDSALALVVEAQQHQQDALRLNPRDPSARASLRTHCLVEANVWETKGDLSRAAEAFRRTIAQDQALANDFPSVPRHRDDLANDHDGLARVLKAAGQTGAAERALRRSLEVSDRLVTDYPDQPRFLDDSAIILDNYGSLLAGTGRTDEAEAIRRRVVARMEGLVGHFPKRTDLRSRLAAALFNLAESRRAHGATAEARQLLERAVSLVESALSDNPRDPDAHRLIGPLREGLAAMPPASEGRSDQSKPTPEETATPRPK